MNATLLTKAEIDLLGKQYASLLMRNARASPSDMPALLQCAAWRNANEYTKKDMCRAVKEKARGLLLGAGYARTLIDNILRQAG